MNVGIMKNRLRRSKNHEYTINKGSSFRKSIKDHECKTILKNNQENIKIENKTHFEEKNS